MMRNLICALSLTSLVLIFPSLIQAQIFNAGIHGGVNISQVDGDGFSGYNKIGPALGLFVNTPVMKSMKAQMEINYSAKGSQFRTTLENPQYYRISLHYIEIPVIAIYSLHHSVNAEAGLSGGYLFLAKEKDAWDEINSTHTFRKVEFAAHAGASWLITEKTSVYARLSYSILPVREHAGGGTWYWNRGQNNNVISFGIQYSL